MSRLSLRDTPLHGLKVVRRERLQDARGSFERLFSRDELADAGWHGPVVQVNRSITRLPGAVRGLHFQHPPHAEWKLVSCLHGEAWDVALDLRRGSPTFLQWHAQRLSPDNGAALLIPPGCAHGFQALTADVELLYCHSAAYAPAAEDGIHPLEPRAGVRWPLPIAMLSDRDAAFRPLPDDFAGVPI